MEEERKISFFLEQISQPGFLIRDGRIQNPNQAAQALLVTSGQEFLPLLHTGSEEYAAFQDGQICLTLSIAEKQHHAVVTQLEDCRLVLLDAEDTAEEFRSMALASMKVPIHTFAARQTTDGRSNITVTISITNTEHLNSVIVKLRKIRDVVQVTRT